MTTLQDAVALAQADRGLAVVSTVRADQTIQASLINAGIVAHPATAEPVLAFVTHGPVKLTNLRARPQIALTFRSGWQWATVEGRSELAGPDDPQSFLRAPMTYACCCRRRSPPVAAPMTTGPSTTAPWRSNVALPCWLHPPASTAMADRRPTTVR